MSVDQKCLDLADHFLSDVKGATADDLDRLATIIQATCEEYCSGFAPLGTP